MAILKSSPGLASLLNGGHNDLQGVLFVLLQIGGWPTLSSRRIFRVAALVAAPERGAILLQN